MSDAAGGGRASGPRTGRPAQAQKVGPGGAALSHHPLSAAPGYASLTPCGPGTGCRNHGRHGVARHHAPQQPRLLRTGHRPFLPGSPLSTRSALRTRSPAASRWSGPWSESIPETRARFAFVTVVGGPWSGIWSGITDSLVSTWSPPVAHSRAGRASTGLGNALPRRFPPLRPEAQCPTAGTQTRPAARRQTPPLGADAGARAEWPPPPPQGCAHPLPRASPGAEPCSRPACRRPTTTSQSATSVRAKRVALRLAKRFCTYFCARTPMHRLLCGLP